MPLYRVCRLRPDGGVEERTEDAASRKMLENRVRAEGDLPLRIRRQWPYPFHGIRPWVARIFAPHGAKIPSLPDPRFGGQNFLSRVSIHHRRPRPGEQVALLRGLATLLTAGQGLDPAFAFLALSLPHPAIRQIAGQIRQHLRAGATLTESLVQVGSISPQAAGLLRAGEAGGTLATSLERLVVMLERDIRLRAMLHQALLYPALLLVLTLLSLTVVLELVVPAFLPLFADSHVTPPWPLRLLASLGDVLRSHGLWLLSGGILILWAGIRITRQPRWRIQCDRLLLRAPYFGPILRNADTARFLLTLGALLEGGLGLRPALVLAHDTLRNAALRQALDTARAGIEAGHGLAAALTPCRLFPDEAVHFLRLGEESGRLGALASQSGTKFTEIVSHDLEQLISHLPMLLTLLMGAIVASVVASLVLAVTSLYELAL